MSVWGCEVEWIFIWCDGRKEQSRQKSHKGMQNLQIPDLHLCIHKQRIVSLLRSQSPLIFDTELIIFQTWHMIDHVYGQNKWQNEICGFLKKRLWFLNIFLPLSSSRAACSFLNVWDWIAPFLIFRRFSLYSNSANLPSGSASLGSWSTSCTMRRTSLLLGSYLRSFFLKFTLFWYKKYFLLSSCSWKNKKNQGHLP